MCWLEPDFPEPEHRIRELPALREESKFLRNELEKERARNKDLQKNIIGRRKANDELVAMMGLLRTETEAVVARHNILLTSDFAKEASARLHEEANAVHDGSTEEAAANGVAPMVPDASNSNAAADQANDGDDERGAGDDEDEERDANEGGEKRASDGGSTGSSPRSKRRKL